VGSEGRRNEEDIGGGMRRIGGELGEEERVGWEVSDCRRNE